MLSQVELRISLSLRTLTLILFADFKTPCDVLQENIADEPMQLWTFNLGFPSQEHLDLFAPQVSAQSLVDYGSGVVAVCGPDTFCESPLSNSGSNASKYSLRRLSWHVWGF